MIEVIAAIARWVQLVANLILLGSCVFLAIASTSTGKRAYLETWVVKLERLFFWLAISIPVGLLIILTATIVQVTGSTSNFWQQEVWLGIVNDTRVGQIWVWRTALAILLLFVVVYLRKAPKARWRYMLCAVTATFPLVAGSFASHTAAEELSVIAITPYALHLILSGIWFGALPAFLLLIYEDNKYEKSTNNLVFETLKRFSSIAFPTMLLIILTGVIVCDRIFDGHFSALVATPYGWLLSTKIFLLGVILLIALRLRSYWLPLLINSKQVADISIGRTSMKIWVRIEFILALLLLLFATLITNTTPVKHAVIENWPFPFRFSIIATWNQPNVETRVWIGLAILLLAVIIIRLGRYLNWGLKRLISISLILIISGLSVALPPLAIQAYPETYRRPLTPFDATSVANGAALYAENCVECHGQQGKGNGIKSRTLSTKLPDLLMESHTVEHTPGDFYNWISYGMVNTDMPGYAEKLSEEDRWDLVNFIHALSRGYQARILTPEIVLNKAYVKPPVFSYTGHDRSNGILQDFRENKAVLLVIFSWPQSQSRIEQLKQAFNQLSEQNIALLAVPSRDLTSEELAQIVTELPFPVVIQGASEIANSYSLFRRTLSHPDIIGRGTNPDHSEFLIDQYGYLRARWIPSIDQSGWSDINMLSQQIYLLNREKTKMPFPEDYVR